MSMSLTNSHKSHSALITGSAKRLGAHLAETLASEGFNLYLHYFKSREEVFELKKKLNQSFPVKIKCIKGDLTKSIHPIVSKCETLGPLKVLVNNASSFLAGSFVDVENIKEQLSINALNPLILSQWFYEQAQHNSLIVNITDANVQAVNKKYQNYRLSKLILNEITRQGAVTYAPKVRVNAIAPGPILPAIGDSKKQFLKKIEKTPLQYSPGLDSVSKCLKFILDCPFLTGQTLYADSGMHLIQ